MLLADLILLLILAGFVFYGLFFGLIRTLGSLVGFVAGLAVAGYFYQPLFHWLENIFFGYNQLGKVIIFVVLFTVVNRLVCFIFSWLEHFFNALSVIPFLKTINRLSGAFLGFVEGGLALGLILYFLGQTSFLGGWLNSLLAESRVAPFLFRFTELILPFWAIALAKIKALGNN